MMAVAGGVPDGMQPVGMCNVLHGKQLHTEYMFVHISGVKETEEACEFEDALVVDPYGSLCLSLENFAFYDCKVSESSTDWVA
jgi:hypothetical protein